MKIRLFPSRRLLAALLMSVCALTAAVQPARAESNKFEALRSEQGVTSYIALGQAMLKTARSPLVFPMGKVDPSKLKHLTVVELEGNISTRSMAANIVRAVAKDLKLERIYESTMPEASHIVFAHIPDGRNEYDAVVVWVSDDSEVDGKVSIVYCEGVIPQGAFKLNLNLPGN